MARQHRIEYAGALYHVMARGGRREPIVSGDADCEMFLETLGEACQRTGFIVHAYDLEAKKSKTANGYGGAQMQAHSELRARRIVASGLKLFNLEEQDMSR